MARPVFSKKIIGELVNDLPVSPMNTFCTVADFNRDGFPDFVTCGRYGRMAWFENPGVERGDWTMHLVDACDNIECGGFARDLTGNGWPDIVNGSDGGSDILWWWENPGRAEGPWKRRMICRTGHNQLHDTAYGPVKNDAQDYIVFTNQGGGTTLYCIPIPQDPRVSPWPGLEVIGCGLNLPNPGLKAGIQPDEGIALGDVDNDGNIEIVCGLSWFKYNGGEWHKHRFTDQIYITNKLLVADIDYDGKNEIVASEGDAWTYGHKEGGKLAIFNSGDDPMQLWHERILETGQLDAHTIRLADLCGNGRLDLLVGEIGGVADTEDYVVRPPRLLVYENDGQGNFLTRHIVDEGTGTHEACLVDLLNRGMLDIVGKPLHGPEKWKIHAWYNKGLLK